MQSLSIAIDRQSRLERIEAFEVRGHIVSACILSVEISFHKNRDC